MDYTQNFFESIEYRNAEFNSILYGSDYLKGLQVNNVMRVIKKLDISYFIDAIKLKLVNIKYSEKNITYDILADISTYESYLRLSEKKIVIYTCILGGYDSLREPLLAFNNVEYICFVDEVVRFKALDRTKWIIRPIPEKISKYCDKTLLNRYIKMHPAELFPNADYAVYVDGNIGIQSFLGSYLMKTEVKTGIAVFSHSQRQCAYVEAQVCISRRKGNKEAMVRQMLSYDKEGFPRDYGLYECTIIASDLKNMYSVEILDKWWQEFLNSKSGRDQLSLPYVMWRLGMNYMDIGLLGENIFNDSRITVYSH